MRRMAKKGSVFLLAALFVVLFACGFDSQGKKVYDDGDLLTDAEEDELQKFLVKTAQRTEQDLIIVTTWDNQGKDAVDYADDFYDDHGFGYEKKNGSGVLFLIDMDGRTIYISTAGKAIEKYTDAEIEDTLDEIMPYMRSEDYAEACSAFISKAEKCLMGGETAKNGYYDEKQDRFVEYTDKELARKKVLEPGHLLITFAGAAAISAVIVFFISRSRKTKMGVTGGDYMKKGGLRFRERSDRFTHTTVVTRHIQKNDGGHSGGGGGHSHSHSSSHTSRGGHSHGGGGRRF